MLLEFGETCLRSDAPGAGSLVARYSTLYAFSKYTELFAGTVELGLGIGQDDPQLVDAPGRDFHLSPGSPAIDLADSASPFCLEPDPNGCRANAGAYGGTPAATASVADTPHCPCP